MATIQINGKQLEAEAGEMIIAVADRVGIAIPRFCYHKHLSIAANCRMCLVEVEKINKAVPACATPISDGMKVFTQSPKAITAQKAVMEFLLINHPLDCPICDQGGECELQDVAMGYGDDISRYHEGKRSVDDEDLGSLIATDMTRCIHCTRCVRFGEEIAGLRELGATGRGEDMRIGTYIKHSIGSEISGNIIDLCPVGALTNKPFRFKARAWELRQHPTIAPHDCFGSNIYVHTRRGEPLRVVPQENPSINETWISDRDRYSVYGLNHHDRVTKPMIKQKGSWEAVDWQTALAAAAEQLMRIQQQHGSEQIAAITTPNATLEDAYLLQRICRGLGSQNVDHRCREFDVADQVTAPLYPRMDLSIADLENQQTILLVGSDLQREQPLAAIRIRKAIQNNEAKLLAISSIDFKSELAFNEKIIVNNSELPLALAKVAKALLAKESATDLPPEAAECLANIVTDPAAESLAKQLLTGDKTVIMLGALAQHHPQAAAIRSLSELIARLSHAKYVCLTDGCNAAGAWLAGAIPHREAAGKPAEKIGLSANAALAAKLKAYLLLAIEPEFDSYDPQQALASLQAADCVVALTTFASADMLQYANVILPIAAFTETSGTYINVADQWQSFQGCTQPVADVRPAWKVLRVLGNLLKLDGFDYTSSQEIHDEVKNLVAETKFVHNKWHVPNLSVNAPELSRIGQWPIYRVDAVVRRSQPLQQSAAAAMLAIYVNSKVAKRFNLRTGREATVMKRGGEVTLPVVIDDRLPDDGVYVPCGYAETIVLGAAFGPIDLK